MSSKFSLEIVFDGSESDVDLIVIVSGWTLLRFISKMTIDCIIVPFAMDKCKKRLKILPESSVHCARRSDHRISSSRCKRSLMLSDTIPVVVDSKMMVSVEYKTKLTPNGRGGGA